jgi:hypothetical protein
MKLQTETNTGRDEQVSSKCCRLRLKRVEVYFDGGLRHGIMDHPSVVPPIFGAVLTIITDEQQCDKIVAQSPIVPVPDVDIATGWTAHRLLSSLPEN